MGIFSFGGCEYHHDSIFAWWIFFTTLQISHCCRKRCKINRLIGDVATLCALVVLSLGVVYLLPILINQLTNDYF